MKSLQITRLQKLAVRSGNLNLIQPLKKFLDVELARDSEGNTLAVLAVKFENFSLLELFLDWGVPAHITNNEGLTALDLANQKGLKRFVDFLEGFMNRSFDEVVHETNVSQCHKAESSNHYDKCIDITDFIDKHAGVEIIEWESEEEINRPANNEELQSRLDSVAVKIRKYRPNKNLDKSWSHVLIDLPVLSTDSVKGDLKFPKLSRFLGMLKEQKKDISCHVFFRYFDHLPSDQRPQFDDEELLGKLEEIGICFNELSLTSEQIKTSQVSIEVCEIVDAVLSEDYSISDLWVARILEQANSRDVLSREGEVEIAVRMDAALLSIKKLLNSIQSINIKEQILLYLNGTYSRMSSEIESDQSDDKLDKELFIETELELSETSEFLVFLLDNELTENIFIPRPTERDIVFLRGVVSIVLNGDVSKYDYFVNRYYQARNQFFESNLRLVYSLAKRYRTTNSLQIEDYLQFGFIGLLRAIEKWDYTLGYKFSTYATWWIRQSISRANSDFGLTIRLPVHISEKLYKLQIEQDRFERQGMEVSLQDLASALEVKEPVVRHLMEIDAKHISIEHLININSSELFFNSPDLSDDPKYIVCDERRSYYIARALEHLEDRERDIIVKRFGLFNEVPHTLEEVGQLAGITRERIRQIESKAIKKLSGPTCSTYFDGEDAYLNWKALEKTRIIKLSKP